MRRLLIVLIAVATGCASVPAKPIEVPEPSPLSEDRTSLLLAPSAAPAEQPVSGGTATIAPPSSSSLPERAPQALVVASVPEQKQHSMHQPATTAHKPIRRKGAAPSAEKKAGLDGLAARNDEKMLQIYVGMYQKTVKSVLSDRRNPYKKETLKGLDGQTYEIAFYLTREPRKGKPLTDRMFTPVIFRQGKVVGIGAYQYKRLLRNKSLDREKPRTTTIRAAS